MGGWKTRASPCATPDHTGWRPLSGGPGGSRTGSQLERQPGNANATWDDFWLNEGFTVYFEHRIMEEVYGKEYSEMLASLTRDELIDDM
ncbi:MAG: M1 family aminopeptidase [Owenweeksia sp.]|nr:M1 family aminopeptidase [Owenweeksia sp.]